MGRIVRSQDHTIRQCVDCRRQYRGRHNWTRCPRCSEIYEQELRVAEHDATKVGSP